MARKPKKAAVEPGPAASSLDNVPRWQKTDALYVTGQAAIDGVDALALQAERRWGCGRLRLLVDDELRAKFDSQRLKLRYAVLNGELADVLRETKRMKNAWIVLDAAAQAANAQPLAPEVWEVTLPSGRVLALVRTTEEARHVAASGRVVDVMTLAEVAHVVDGFPELVRIKQTFPGAEVTAVREVRDPVENWDEFRGDPIPFGGDVHTQV